MNYNWYKGRAASLGERQAQSLKPTMASTESMQLCLIKYYLLDESSFKDLHVLWHLILPAALQHNPTFALVETEARKGLIM